MQLFSSMLVVAVLFSQAAQKPKLTVNMTGYTSGISKPETVLISDMATWRKVWSRHTARVIDPKPPCPLVDFSKHRIIAAFAGNKPTGGYAVKFEPPTESAQTVTYQAIVTAPPPDGIVSQMVTQPFAIMTVNKTGKKIKVAFAQD